MAVENPFTVVPYHDPFIDDQLRTIENFLMSDDTVESSPTLQTTDGIFDVDHGDNYAIVDINDPIVLDPFQDTETGQPCREQNEACYDHHTNDGEDQNVNFFVQSPLIEHPLPLSVMPVPIRPCNSCQVLREITHTNGANVAKLEIHGRLGVIHHAVLEEYRIDFSTSDDNHDYHMFDFCNESATSVKQFLGQYCEDRKRSGYIMLQDPLSVFYEAICVGMDWEESVDTDDLVRNSSFDSGEYLMNQHETIMDQHDTVMDQHETEGCGERLARSSLALQRERTGKLTLKDFVKYFDIPIEIAARKMQVCPTVIKKICRKHGLSRWPHRKIKAIERKISRKAKGLTSTDAEERASAQSDIERLQQEIANIYSRYDS